MSSSNETTWRVFCAIEIPIEIRARIAKHAQQLHESLPDVQARWSKPDNIHLTLKFFGNISQEQVSKASEGAARAVDAFKPFRIEVKGTGSFQPRGPAPVLWIGINDPTGNLIRLQQRFETECAREGFSKEDRRFHPHLTVARLRGPRGAKPLTDKHNELGFKAAEMIVSSLILFRSELSSKGSTYSRISTHRLE